MLPREASHKSNEEVFSLFILEAGCPAISQCDAKHLDFLAIMRDVQLSKCFEQQGLKLLTAEPLSINFFFPDVAYLFRKMLEHVVHAIVRSLYREIGQQLGDGWTDNGNHVVKQSTQPRRYDLLLKRSLCFLFDCERKVGLFVVYRHTFS